MASRDRGRARMVAGLANHRRIEIVRLLLRRDALCVNDVASLCKISQPTAVEHVKRLHESGLVTKKSKGRRVLLSVTKRAAGMLRVVDAMWESSE